MAKETIITWLDKLSKKTIQETRNLNLYYLEDTCKSLEKMQKNFEAIDVPGEVFDICKFEWEQLCDCTDEENYQKYDRRLVWLELQYELISK